MPLFNLLTPLLLSSFPVQTGPTAPDEPQPDNVEAFLRSQMQKRRIPGLQFAIVRHGKIVQLGAFGLANAEHAIPVTGQTVFPINSATKSFAGVAIMQLVEAGELDLAMSISHYLDDLPSAWQAATVQQILTHMSGLPNIMDDDAKMVSDEGDAAAWAKVKTMPLAFAPGERFSYNQTGYLLLGRIIDKLSGQPFTQFITERQFQVANMPLTAQAGFVDSQDVVSHSAQVYRYFRLRAGQVIHTNTLNHIFEEFPPFLRTAAGIHSTAEELARWIIALQQGRLLQEETSLTTLWTPGLLNNGSLGGFSKLLNGYALGWPTMNRPEHRAVGGVGGGRAAFFVYPDDDLAVVILTNLQGASPESFIDEVAGHYIPDMRASTGFGLPPAIRALRAKLLQRGFEYALDMVNELKMQDAAFDLAEDELNDWGYRLLEQDQTKEAIEILKLNTSLFPNSANTYDSLAEAYEAKGETTLAIKAYRRSFELDPKNTHAEARLKALEPNT